MKKLKSFESMSNIKTNFYVVVSDDNDNIWERSEDFADDGDYFDRELSQVTKENLMTLEEATKFKDELDREIGATNDITFVIKPVEISIY